MRSQFIITITKFLRFDMSINSMALEDYDYFEDIFLLYEVEFLRVLMKEKLFIFLFNLFEIKIISNLFIIIANFNYFL